MQQPERSLELHSSCKGPACLRGGTGSAVADGGKIAALLCRGVEVGEVWNRARFLRPEYQQAERQHATAQRDRAPRFYRAHGLLLPPRQSYAGLLELGVARLLQQLADHILAAGD